MTDIAINPQIGLPIGFHFTQSNLQDFVDCPRRFYLRHMVNQPWPAPTTEPQREFEEAMQRGERFHRLAERHQLGIPLSLLPATDALGEWLGHYQQHLSQLGPFDQSWPEIAFSSLVNNHTIVAKFDLLALKGKDIIAIDWKTGKLPKRASLQKRLQTLVYLCVLKQESERFVGHPLNAYTLTYASVATGETQSFSATTEDYADRLSARIKDILNSRYAKTEDERHCRFCTYRSLCERGTTPTSLGEVDIDDYWNTEDASDSEVEF